MSDNIVRWVTGCPSGVMVTAAVALMLLPAQYYVPELAPALEAGAGRARGSAAPAAPPSWLELALDSPPLDVLLALAFVLLGLLVYFCEWIQRKVMEKRIVKLNRFLVGSVERLRGWDVQQEQLETTLKLVQSATSEYNLLLYLLLRQHGAPLPPRARSPSAKLPLDL